MKDHQSRKRNIFWVLTVAFQTRSKSSKRTPTTLRTSLLFLPSGNMSDLILRTKMRTFATHFAADNFPKMERFSTTKPLSVYCAYDSRLSQYPAFVEALDSRFPQSSNRELIFNKEISILKISLSPQELVKQPS